MNKEIWKDVIIEKNGIVHDYTGKYQVSNLGRIKSLRFFNGRCKKYVNREIILKQPTNKYGYLRVCLSKNNKHESFFVHRLVANAFLENPNNLPQINHKNEIKTDNRAENLEWCDSKYNINYGTRTKKVAEKRSKPVICIELNITFENAKSGVEHVGLTRETIRDCVSGKCKTAGGYTWRYAEDEL